MKHHRDGTGARLVQVIRETELDFVVAREWSDGTRDDERRLKKRGGASRFCPICRGDYRH